MANSSDASQPKLLDQIRTCLSNRQTTEATILICGALGGKSINDYDADEEEALSLFFSNIINDLLNHHITWLQTNPNILSLILDLVEHARELKFDPAKCSHYVFRIHCIQAYYYANHANWEQAKVQLTQAVNADDPSQIMENGGSNLPQSLLIEYLMENLWIASQKEKIDPKAREDILALYSELKDIVSCVTREETRSGVVRIILVDMNHKKAVIRLLFVGIEESEEQHPQIRYLPASNEKLAEQPKSAQPLAMKAANHYLKTNDYPDGLDGKRIVWQILTAHDLPPQDTKDYEGDSLGLALCTAIVSEYLKQIIPSDITFTGAFHIDSIDDGRISPVNFIPIKIKDAIKAGMRVIYLPEANKQQLDVATLKIAEEKHYELKYVRNIQDVFNELFVKSVPPGIAPFLKDMAGTLKEFIYPRKTEETHPREVAPSHRVHIWLSTLMMSSLFVMDWFMLTASFTPISFLRITLGWLLIVASLLLSYALPYQLIRRKRTDSWYASIYLTLIAVTLCILLVIPDVPWKITDISEGYDWPPIFALCKDYFIFWIFVWVFGTNVFNVHVAYQSLLAKRQFKTLRQCLRWDSALEGNMPIVCFPFPTAWGLLAMAIVAIFLLYLEVEYYLSFREEFEHSVYISTMGISRDLLFIMVAGEVMIFYKKIVAETKRRLFD